MKKIVILLCVVGIIYCVDHAKEKTVDAGCSRTDGCDWRYMVYFPNTFRTGYTEKIAVATYGFPETVELNITLSEYNPTRSVFSTNSYTVEPETLIELDYYIPHDAPNYLKVEINGYGKTADGYEWHFSNRTKDKIYVQKLGYNIFIQTDRPVYKPGQKILSRVVVVDSNLKPAEGYLESVVIESPSGSRMRQWNNVSLNDGFASFELQTSEKPVLGKWKIKVKMLTYEKEIKIEVKKYVLPKFEVTITPPPFLTYFSKEIKFEICARYSYGKSVYGRVSASICRKRRYYYRPAEKDTCYLFTGKIHGCRVVRINSAELDFNTHMKGYSSMYVDIKAHVEEKATGIKLKSKEVSVDIDRKDVQLSFETRESFKPGLPLGIKLFAKYPDGTPISNLQVNVSAGTKGYLSRNLINNKVVDIVNGVYNVDIPKIPFNAQSLRLSAVYRRDALYEEEPSYRRESTVTETIAPWYSPSHNYLQIEKTTVPFKNGTSGTLTVHYTSSNKETTKQKIFYSIMCAGNLAASGSMEHTFVTSNKINQVLEKEDDEDTPKVPIKEFLIKIDDDVDDDKDDSGNDDNDDKDDVDDADKDDDVDDIDDDDDSDEDAPPPTPVTLLTFTLRDPFAIPTRPPFPETFSLGKFDISFPVTDKMFPKCRMVVYYIHGEEVVADSTFFDVVDEFKNKVKIGFSNEEVRPGNSVKLVMKGYPKSRVAVAAVDKSIHFLADGNDIKPKDLQDIREDLDIAPGYVSEYGRCRRSWERKRRSSPIFPYFGNADYVDSEKAFANTGTKFLTNLRIDVRPCAPPRPIPLYRTRFTGDERMADREGSAGSDNNTKNRSKPKARPRTNFPETWIWEEAQLSEEGTKTFEVNVPDTITSWYASGFAISKEAGLGIANPAELRVFQPFFISLNLPYSVIRGEDVMVPAAVFSYLENSCLTVKITLAYSADYQMIAGPSAKSCICGGRSSTVLFRIKPKRLDRIPIRISAETLEENECAANLPFNNEVQMADILVKKLLVEPEGIKKDYTISIFFCPKDSVDGIFKTDLDLKLPENLIEGSVFSKITAMGDIMGSSLSDVDKLLAMPYGCGEQNMLKFAPNIFIMNYLKNTGQSTPKIETKALNYMRTGYQRELTYKHEDGSYSAFGERDVNGSTWLTAFVMKSYAQAKKWIEIDENEIQDPFNWLLKQQDGFGCFKSVGELHNKAMAGGVKTPVTLTAYVLTALLEAGLSKDDPRAEDGHYCVANYIDQIKDSYSLAIIANMYAKLENQHEYESVMEKLRKLAISEDGMIHYEEPKKEDDKKTNSWWYYQARSTDIEQTAYALLAILEKDGKDGIPDAVPIVRWLSKQRNGLGGWSSTQDTVLAMQALSEFALFTFGDALDVTIDVTDGNDFRHTFNVNNNNNLVLQAVEDIPVPSTLTVHAEGSGCTLIQTIVNYNIKKTESKPSFKISYSTRSIPGKLSSLKSCFSQILFVCVSWLGEGQSNMALLDVEMVSGFEANEENFELQQDKVKGLKDIEVKGNKVSYYFNRLSKTPRCVELRVDQTSNVRKTKPVPMKVYDYYDTEKSATTLYGFSKAQCTEFTPFAP